MRGTTCKNSRGFTLAEAMMAVVVLNIAVAGIVLPFTAGTTIRAEGMHRTLATSLAADLMEKINNTSYDDIVSNYNYIELQGQVKDYNGVVFTSSNYANFSRQVICEYVRVSQQFSGTQPFFIRATVIVSYKGNELVRLTRLIGR
jgi:Tfp pilus assembly protein PilV